MVPHLSAAPASLAGLSRQIDSGSLLPELLQLFSGCQLVFKNKRISSAHALADETLCRRSDSVSFKDEDTRPPT